MQNPNDTFNVGISFSLVLLLSKLVICHKHSTNPLLLLISFDGFRWDYLKNHSLSNFEALKQNGSYADFVYSSFSTVTFPNHWTLVTGLYEESHGIIQNEMYDPVLQKTFSYTSSESQTIEWYGQNKQVEPIWTSNQKADKGRRSAAEWVGANVVFDNQTINYIPYNRSTAYTDLVDKFIALFTDAQQPINFGALYFDEPDHTGHLYGPYSIQMKEKLENLNTLLGYLIEQLKSHHLFDKLNVIITSDHGMDQISNETSIFLSSYLDLSLIDARGSRACYHLFLKNKSNFDTVFDQLKKVPHIDFYKHSEIPVWLHYKNNVRVGDIVIFTHVGYSVYLEKDIDWPTTNGDHGYYNNISSMHSIFIAHGPGFKKGVQVKPFHNIDIYPLMCYLLGISVHPNNGSLERVVNMLVLKEVNNKFGFVFFSLILIPISIVAFTCLFTCLAKRHSRYDSKDNVECEYVSVATSESAMVNSNLD